MMAMTGRFLKRRMEEYEAQKAEAANEPYALAKIADIKLCESYNRQFGASHGSDYPSVMPITLKIATSSLLGDPTNDKLGWAPQIALQEMVTSDLADLGKQSRAQRPGFRVSAE